MYIFKGGFLFTYFMYCIIFDLESVMYYIQYLLDALMQGPYLIGTMPVLEVHIERRTAGTKPPDPPSFV
jgi:hypothetical protein